MINDSYQRFTNDFNEICGKPRELANQCLEAARKAKDSNKEASALIDLGTVHSGRGEFKEAFERFEQALVLARDLHDRNLESDCYLNLATAYLNSGQALQACDLLERQIAYAQSVGDLYLEKLALDHLGMVYGTRAESGPAIEIFQRALAIAEQTGDRQHQADLQWLLAIQNAQIGLRDQALSFGRDAITLFEELANPDATDFNEKLNQYAEGNSGTELAMPKKEPSALGYYTGTTTASANRSIPGLRMLWGVFMAAKSMATFFTSGMKRVTPAAYEKRLQTCAGCSHHTGVRCKICGCFTSLKAWLPHERCPIGNWSDNTGPITNPEKETAHDDKSSAFN
jgi:tetratricopeptide (TPR) repeat protein